MIERLLSVRDAQFEELACRLSPRLLRLRKVAVTGHTLNIPRREKERCQRQATAVRLNMMPVADNTDCGTRVIAVHIIELELGNAHPTSRLKVSLVKEAQNRIDVGFVHLERNLVTLVALLVRRAGTNVVALLNNTQGLRL